MTLIFEPQYFPFIHLNRGRAEECLLTHLHLSLISCSHLSCFPAGLSRWLPRCLVDANAVASFNINRAEQNKRSAGSTHETEPVSTCSLPCGFNTAKQIRFQSWTCHEKDQSETLTLGDSPCGRNTAEQQQRRYFTSMCNWNQIKMQTVQWDVLVRQESVCVVQQMR